MKALSTGRPIYRVSRVPQIFAEVPLPAPAHRALALTTRGRARY
jgi:hypothetical protein